MCTLLTCVYISVILKPRRPLHFKWEARNMCLCQCAVDDANTSALLALAWLQALARVLPAVAQHKLDRGGYMILRPDSGDPTEAVLMALQVELLLWLPSARAVCLCQ